MKTLNVEEILERDILSLSELYHENSKLRRHDVSTGLRIGSIERTPIFVHSMSRAFKTYPTAPQLPLRDVSCPESLLEDAIVKRRSIREYAPHPLEWRELSKLLHYSYGITGRIEFEAGGVRGMQPLRAAPSGGALYPIEIYVALLQSQDVPVGLYHYNPRDHILEDLRRADIQEKLAKAVTYPQIIRSCSVVFLLTGLFQRSRFKYGERGYRLILLEAGHIAQNLCLMATALELGSLCLAGFYDDEIDQILAVDGVHESVLYLVAVGEPQDGISRK